MEIRYRHDYAMGILRRQDLEEDPLQQFYKWFRIAQGTNIREPNAFILSTATLSGRPSGRVLLMRLFDERGLIFFTNYASRKAKELTENPYAAATFWWEPLEQQVRIEGKVSLLSMSESAHYFASRSRQSQIGAWASQQSKELHSKSALQEQMSNIEQKFKDREVELPPFWGGYCLTVTSFEFWQGRPNRLHDRFLYLKTGGQWVIRQLSP